MQAEIVLGVEALDADRLERIRAAVVREAYDFGAGWVHDRVRELKPHTTLEADDE